VLDLVDLEPAFEDFVLDLAALEPSLEDLVLDIWRRPWRISFFCSSQMTIVRMLNHRRHRYRLRHHSHHRHSHCSSSSYY
jgi:hypothetical protein